MIQSLTCGSFGNVISAGEKRKTAPDIMRVVNACVVVILNTMARATDEPWSQTMGPDLRCPKCGDELEIRYEEFSEEILGLYCEDCQLIKYEDENDFQPVTKDTYIGNDYPWNGTGDWGPEDYD